LKSNDVLILFYQKGLRSIARMRPEIFNQSGIDATHHPVC